MVPFLGVFRDGTELGELSEAIAVRNAPRSSLRSPELLNGAIPSQRSKPVVIRDQRRASLRFAFIGCLWNSIGDLSRPASSRELIVAVLGA